MRTTIIPLDLVPVPVPKPKPFQLRQPPRKGVAKRELNHGDEELQETVQCEVQVGNQVPRCLVVLAVQEEDRDQEEGYRQGCREEFGCPCFNLRPPPPLSAVGFCSFVLLFFFCAFQIDVLLLLLSLLFSVFGTGFLLAGWMHVDWI